jgi:putative oxidoreductase
MAVSAGLAGYAYAAMRIVIGFLFAFHGMQKILGMFGGKTAAIGSQPWAAGMIELIGGALVAIGLFTSPVAFICSGEMAAAYFIAHVPRGVWPIQNGGELAALYAFVFLYISAHGGGPLSVDRVWRRKA